MRKSLLAICLLSLTACGDDDGMAASAVSADPLETPTESLESTEELRARSVDLGPREEMPGAALYAENCSGCHDGTVPKAPHLHWLEMMSPGAVLKAMNEGLMQAQAEMLNPEQRMFIAEYVTMQPADGSDGSQEIGPLCSGPAGEFDAALAPVKAGWGHDTDRYYAADIAGMDAADLAGLELKWAYAFPGALRARSQPAVGFGAVYAGSHDGTVYAFDLETGCIRWHFAAAAEVRTGIVLTDSGEKIPALALFGDILARIYALDAFTGELVWSRKADEHPSATLTGTPALADGRLFVPVSSLEVLAAADPAYECCSFRGKVLTLEAATGGFIWEHHTIPELPAEVTRTRVGTRVLAPSGAPTWTSPALDRRRGRIYIGTGENYSSPADGNSDAVIAIDMATGERAWQWQSTANDAWNVACMMDDNPNCPEEDGPDFDHGSSMILVDLPDGKQVLAVGHKNGTVFGLDPDDEGAVLWSTRVGRGSIQGGVHFGMAVEGTTIFVPINDMNNTYNGDRLDPDAARPGMHAVDARDGKVIWSHVQKDVCPPELSYCDPGISAPASAIPGAVIAGHLDGFLRAFDGASGEVLWEYDTKRPVKAVNGLVARGGGMSGAGPAIVDGHLIVNSGYGLYFHEPGNMLAVFTPGGR